MKCNKLMLAAVVGVVSVPALAGGFSKLYRSDTPERKRLLQQSGLELSQTKSDFWKRVEIRVHWTEILKNEVEISSLQLTREQGPSILKKGEIAAPKVRQEGADPIFADDPFDLDEDKDLELSDQHVIEDASKPSLVKDLQYYRVYELLNNSLRRMNRIQKITSRVIKVSDFYNDAFRPWVQSGLPALERLHTAALALNHPDLSAEKIEDFKDFAEKQENIFVLDEKSDESSPSDDELAKSPAKDPRERFIRSEGDALQLGMSLATFERSQQKPRSLSPSLMGGKQASPGNQTVSPTSPLPYFSSSSERARSVSPSVIQRASQGTPPTEIGFNPKKRDQKTEKKK